VRLDGIHREGGDKTIHGMELVLLHGQATNLGGADRSEVGWMGKQDGPLSLLPFMERFPFTLRSVACKVWDNVAKTDACGADDVKKEKVKAVKRCALPMIFQTAESTSSNSQQFKYRRYAQLTSISRLFGVQAHVLGSSGLEVVHIAILGVCSVQRCSIRTVL
jgi:hypothetical protein